jgi:phosphatidylinositol kinase/protein kinase (PI-3  family)
MNPFSKTYLIRQSNKLLTTLHPAFVAQAYRPLAGQLFNISFISVWDELFANESHDVVEDIPLINGLELALHSPQIPPYIMNALLNLAEFMVRHKRCFVLLCCVLQYHCGRTRSIFFL